MLVNVNVSQVSFCKTKVKLKLNIPYVTTSHIFSLTSLFLSHNALLLLFWIGLSTKKHSVMVRKILWFGLKCLFWSILISPKEKVNINDSSLKIYPIFYAIQTVGNVSSSP